jgi:hypothetical protein
MTHQDLSVEAIQFRLARTAVWRRSLAAKYPTDLRNIRAAERLDELAEADPRKISADTLAALAAHVESQAFQDAANEAARCIGFASRPASINDFFKIVLAKLAAPSIGGAN